MYYGAESTKLRTVYFVYYYFALVFQICSQFFKTAAIWNDGDTEATTEWHKNEKNPSRTFAHRASP